MDKVKFDQVHMFELFNWYYPVICILTSLVNELESNG